MPRRKVIIYLNFKSFNWKNLFKIYIDFFFFLLILQRFVVRDFKYDENDMENQRKEFEEVGAVEKELAVNFD